MKILSIKKRNPLMTILDIDAWKVEVELPNGTNKKFNCWAGGYSSPESVESLMHSLEQKTGEPYFREFLEAHFDNRPPRIEGLEKAYLAIENKHFHFSPSPRGGASGGTITIGVQNQTQVKTATQIQAQLRLATTTKVGVSIRRGK